MTLKNKRLLITTSTFPRWNDDNIPSFVFDHAVRLGRDFRSVAVLAPHYKGAKLSQNMESIKVRRFRYAIPYSSQNIVYESQGVRRVSKSPFYIFKLLSFLIAQTFNVINYGAKVDVINAHWIIPQGFVAVLTRRITGAKVVVTVHGSDIFSMNGRLMTKCKRYVLKNADRVIVNSTATEKACKKIFNREYPIIPMGVDVARFAKTKKNKNKSSKFTILFVGRLSEEKGLKYLLKAAVKLKKHKDVEFLIVGDGPLHRWLAKFIKDNNLSESVHLKGWVNQTDLPKIMKNSDIFVGPSVVGDNGSQEAFGIVYVEAAAAGLPVIATNVGGIADVVVNEKTGFLVPQKDSDALLTKILELKDNPDLRRTMGINAEKHAENFSWDKRSKQYKEVFISVLGQN